MAGQDHHRDRSRQGVGAKGFEDSDAVKLWQTHVKKDDVRQRGAGHLQSHLAVTGHIHAVAVKLQLELVHLGDGRVVLYEKHVHVLIGTRPV